MKNFYSILVLYAALSLYLASDDDLKHSHDAHEHQKFIDGKNLEVDQERFNKFLEDLKDSQVAVVNVKGMVCDFCARGIEKTFKKDTQVVKIDVDLNKGKVLIAYTKDKLINFEDIKTKILANGQNATGMKILNI
jgi:copper chaperone CopZ|tara:strand:- start:31 stop:435 length:405 start_codon:yes stop_codon:yes gene_type:complete